MSAPHRPDRRSFLRGGSAALASAVLLAACSSDVGGDDSATTTSTTAVPGTTPGPEVDLVLLNTAISFEILAVDTYRAVLDSGLVTSAEFAGAARMFQAHHAEHRSTLAAVVEAADGQPYATANSVLKAGIVDPGLRYAVEETDLVRLSYDLEQMAAQAHVFAATTLSTPELRQGVLSIGCNENRHATVLELIGELTNDKPTFFPATDPLPTDARLTS